MLDLRSRLTSASEKTQLELIQEVAATGDQGLAVLMDLLLERRGAIAQQRSIDLVAGKAYQVLVAAESDDAQDFLKTHFPQGVVLLSSERGIDYTPLQQLLAQRDFEAADRVTLQKMCELAGAMAIQRKWVYFTEAENFPVIDLRTIDCLWQMHSEGRFGFWVQRDIWLSLGKNWDRFWEAIGWKTDNNWTRYPQAFTWNLTAPKGHLPLSNQLRGIRVISSLMGHPAWNEQD
jgi:hypothetical protein